MAALMVSGMTGQGSVAHNNRSFYAQNVDKSRSHQNITVHQEDIKAVYHQLFDQALEAYNSKKKKTRDKIPDYYEHIRQGKQEKIFHEVIFQIGNKDTCPCGSPEGAQVAEILVDFAKTFQSRNPHLRVFNAVLHMDEATPHVHIDFVPFATGQKRGLSTRVSMKQALKQQGFTGISKQNSEWTRWMESEKQVLEDMARSRGLEIEHGEGGRQHLDTPTYIAAKRREEEAVAQCAELEQQKQEAVEGLQKATESLQNAQRDLGEVEHRVEALRDSEADLERSRASLTEEVEALKHSAASPAEVDEAERAAKTTLFRPGQVILPKKTYEQLLASAKASAGYQKDANEAQKESKDANEAAQKAKDAAKKAENRCHELESEVRKLKADIDQLQSAADLGNWFAAEHKHTPFQTMAEQFSKAVAQLVYKVLGKPDPERKQQPMRGSLTARLTRAGEEASDRNQGQPSLSSWRERDGRGR